MSFRDCVDTLVSGGKLSAKAGDELKKVWSQEFARTRDAAAAKDAVLDHLDRAATHGKRTALLQQHAVTAAETRVKNYRAPSGHQDVAHALVEEMHAVHYQHKANRNLAFQQMEEAIHDGRKGLFSGDLRRAFGEAKVRWDNVVRERFGEATGDETAKRVAAIVGKTLEDMRLAFNAAGGAVGKLKDWGLPQGHNAKALLEAKLDKWREFTIERLDPEAMTHPVLGRPMTRAEVWDSLAPIYDNVVSGGAIDIVPSRAPQGMGALHTRHADHRFLKFKNAGAWLEYQEAFGNRDPFASIMRYVDTMARDTAAMERFGPNPQQTVNYLRSLAEQQGGLAAAGRPAMLPAMEAKAAQSYVSKKTDRFGDMWDLFRGTTNAPVGHQLNFLFWKPELSQVAGDLRNIVSIGGLGFSAISSISDIASHASARQLAGMDSNYASAAMNAFIQTVKGFKGLSKRQAVEASLGLESAAHALHMQAREVGGIQGSFFTSWLTDRSLTWNLNQPLAQAGQHAFGTQLLAKFHGEARATQKALLIVDAIKQGYDVPKIFGFDGGGTTQSHMLRLHDAAIAGVEDLLKAENRKLDPVTRGRREAQLARLQADRERVKSGSHVSADLAEIIRTGEVDVLAVIDPAIRRMLERNGITGEEWARMSGAMLAGATKDPQLRPQHIAALDVENAKELSQAYLRMVLREMDHAVITDNLEVKAGMLGKTRAGTWVGERTRVANQFLSFAAIHAVQQVRRALEIGAHDGVPSAAVYAAKLVLASTLLGAAALQLKEVFKTRETRDMADPRFWGHAFLQGGGIGIMGDYMFNDLNRFGGSMGATSAGPLWNRLTTVKDLTLGNAKQLYEGKPTKFGKESAQLLRQNMPVPFYLRPVWDRVLMDEVQKLVDPEAHKAFRDAERRQRKDYGNDFWWQPGSPRPQFMR